MKKYLYIFFLLFVWFTKSYADIDTLRIRSSKQAQTICYINQDTTRYIFVHLVQEGATMFRYFLSTGSLEKNAPLFLKDTIAENEACPEKSLDVYPHGGVLPGRNYVNSLGVPYQYQGMEKDQETGLLNFELRQYDARLGRWFNPDPMGQYHSPYLAMGNNPISQIDPTGGWSNGDFADQWEDGVSLYDRYTQTYNPDAVSHSEFDNNYNHGGSLGGHIEASGNYVSNETMISEAHDSWIDNHVKPLQDKAAQDIALIPANENNEPVLDGRAVEIIGFHTSSKDMYNYIKEKGKLKEKGFWSKVDDALGSGLFGSVDNYNAVRLKAGDNNPYMFNRDELNTAANYQLEAMSYFIPVGEIFQGLKWAGRGIGLLSKGEGRIFWSGGKVAMDKATQEAIINGGKTLEMSKRGQILTTITKVIPYKYTEPLWKLASKSWASGAEGSARVFLYPPAMRADAIWNLESKILKEHYVEIIPTIIK